MWRRRTTSSVITDLLSANANISATAGSEWARLYADVSSERTQERKDEPLSTDCSRVSANLGAGRREFSLGEPTDAGARRWRDPGSRAIPFARSVHARPHERRQVLCQA